MLWEQDDYGRISFIRLPKEFLAPISTSARRPVTRSIRHWPQRPVHLPWGEIPGVAVDKADRIWLFTRAKPCVQVYEPSGKFVRAWDPGIGIAHFIRFDPQGNVWLTDLEKHVVMCFSPRTSC